MSSWAEQTESGKENHVAKSKEGAFKEGVAIGWKAVERVNKMRTEIVL